METVSTPRVSAALLPSFVGRNVMVVGKVLQLRGDTAMIDADGHVTANLDRESHLMAGNGAQIIGKVNPDQSIRVYNALDLGTNVAASPPSSQPERPISSQFSQLDIHEETTPIPQFSQSTTQSTQPSQLFSTQSTTLQSTQDTTQPDFEQATPPSPLLSSSEDEYPDVISTTNDQKKDHDKDKDQDKHDFTFSSPLPKPTSFTGAVRTPPSSSPQTTSSPRRTSRRLFRTRSGNLASAAEVRQRRQLEAELWTMVLEGIGVVDHNDNGTDSEGREEEKGKGKGSGAKPRNRIRSNQLLRSVPMGIDDAGRWRIVRQDDALRDAIP